MTPNQTNLIVHRQFRGSNEAERGSMWDIMAAARLQFDCQCHLSNLSSLGSYAMTAAKLQLIRLTDIFGANTTESVLEKYGINRILDRNPSNGVWVLPLRTICWVSQITVPNQPTNSAKKKATQLCLWNMFLFLCLGITRQEHLRLQQDISCHSIIVRPPASVNDCLGWLPATGENMW